VSALTFPFVLITWLLLLATYGFSGLKGFALLAGGIVTDFQPIDASPLKVVDFAQGVLQSISQVFLGGSGIAALLLLAGLAVNSVAAAAFALAKRDIGRSHGPSFRCRTTGHGHVNCELTVDRPDVHPGAVTPGGRRPRERLGQPKARRRDRPNLSRVFALERFDGRREARP
jgi:hypothetical protein